MPPHCDGWEELVLNIKHAVGILAIVAVIVLLIVFTPTVNKDDPEKQFGYRLFQFGNAAAAYAAANPKGFTPEDERLVFYGYEWLQPEFLPETFSLNTADLTVGDVQTRKGPAKVVLNVREMGLNQYFLEVELIEIGKVSAQNNNALSLALKAVTYANNHRHDRQEPEILYHIDIVSDKVDAEKFHIIGKDKELAKADDWGAAEETFER